MISIEARKIALAQALFDLDDESILKEIEQLLSQAQQKEYDNWAPSEEELKGIDEAMKQVENGEAISEEEVRERYKKWLK